MSAAVASLIAATTYRFFGHNVGDSQVYRPKEEVEEWRARDPISRFRSYLVESGALTEAEAEEIAEAATRAVEEAIDFGRRSPEPDVATLLDDVYA